MAHPKNFSFTLSDGSIWLQQLTLICLNTKLYLLLYLSLIRFHWHEFCDVKQGVLCYTDSPHLLPSFLILSNCTLSCLQAPQIEDNTNFFLSFSSHVKSIYRGSRSYLKTQAHFSVQVTSFTANLMPTSLSLIP